MNAAQNSATFSPSSDVLFKGVNKFGCDSSNLLSVLFATAMCSFDILASFVVGKNLTSYREGWDG